MRSAAERAGSIDTSFGGLGYVHATRGGGGALDLAAIRPVGGKILVGGVTYSKLGGGDIAALRYLEDGAADLAFNATGSAYYDSCHCANFSGEVHGIDQRSDGTVLVVGSTAAKIPGRQRSNDLLVLRYKDDGTLGRAPGDTGIDLIDLGGSEEVGAAAFRAGEPSVFVAGERDGELFVAKVQVLARESHLDTQGFAAPRGWAATGIRADRGAIAMALDAAGRVLLAGWRKTDGNPDLVVARVLTSGKLDERFGARGLFGVAHGSTDESSGAALTVLPDGRLLVATDSVEAGVRRLLLVRLLPEGVLDPTFGDGGSARAPLGSTSLELASAITLSRMRDGRILVGANGKLADVEGPVIARFLPDGSLDPTFGTGGEATFVVKQGPDWKPSRHAGEETTLHALALTPDERRLLVSGSWSAYPFKGYVARLWN
ncbi:MAG: hypothetical protein QM820_20075 [Minicystis sp.]